MLFPAKIFISRQINQSGYSVVNRVLSFEG